MHDSDPADEGPDILTASSHDAIVFSWRFEQAERLGLTADEASAFAAGLGDLGVLRDLVAAGCDPELAAAIVT